MTPPPPSAVDSPLQVFGRGALRWLAVLGVAVAGAAVGVGCFVVAYRSGVRPARYPGLSPEVSTAFAVVGTLVGAVGWALVCCRARRARAVLRRCVAVVVGVALLADIAVGVRMGWPGALVLAVEHVVVVALSVLVLRWAIPVPGDDEDRDRPLLGLGTWARWGLAVGLIVVAALWTLVNKPVEGPILLVITYGRGLTAADLVAVAAVGVAVHLARPRRRPDAVSGS